MKMASSVTRIAAATTTNTSLNPKKTPAMVVEAWGRMSGKCTVAGPFHRNMIPSSRNDIPIAVISGARRGALRRGRYATRSIATLMPPMISITIGNTSSRAMTLIVLNDPSVTEKKPRIAVPM